MDWLAIYTFVFTTLAYFFAVLEWIKFSSREWSLTLWFLGIFVMAIPIIIYRYVIDQNKEKSLEDGHSELPSES